MSNDTNKKADGKKRPRRKPMTPEEKAAAAAIRAEEKAQANNLKPELILQYQGSNIDMSALVEAARAGFHATKKRTLVTALKLYVKSEEHAAYYVINGKYKGRISF